MGTEVVSLRNNNGILAINWKSHRIDCLIDNTWCSVGIIDYFLKHRVSFEDCEGNSSALLCHKETVPHVL